MREHPFHITRVLGLVTLTVFTLCVLLLLLTAADFYQTLVNRGESAYARRTALQYLTTRVQQAETVETGILDGCETLILTETVEGERYTTYIYCYNGFLRELYTVSGANLSLQAGESVLEADGYSANQEENLLTIVFDGEELLLQLPAGKMVIP